ncbi:hypothetical protein [Winogradskyella vincentii]|uniref:SGNH hydrolase-type esterase domain-containing protein n=1 Tax=Winogradskyella vincentii TaxID=2877122 RepID=A0ABS7Y180_9FLAO|nr:hypothetical protein [Winogradskyella vincentii]MCA0152999.1 hypothetical protein [Winogradskyella vincentii]
MKKFIINIAIFLVPLLVVGELVARYNHVMSEIPRRFIDSHGIQKYIPNQKGYWQGGEHYWEINSMGWPGELPKDFNNLNVIIGDSFIENFMNPIECHQSNYLKKLMPKYNFMEASRSGVTFIESLEISKQTDTLSPIKTIIFTGPNDIIESIEEIKKINDATQYSINQNTIIKGKMKSPGLKKALYSMKAIYYLYNRFRFSIPKIKKNSKNNSKPSQNKYKKNLSKVKLLLDYVKLNYDIENKLFVFSPKTNQDIYMLFKDNAFNVMLLDNSKDDKWSFDHDPHWTCYGHEQVAKQLKTKLLEDSMIIN